MITYSICMQCQRPLDKWAAAGAEPFRFVLNHGVCPSCRDKMLAEVHAPKPIEPKTKI
jgi:hypothetical protein